MQTERFPGTAVWRPSRKCARGHTGDHSTATTGLILVDKQ